VIPDIGDVIEVDIPEKNLCAGIQGTVVHCHESDVYEIEFTNDNGETLDFLALHKKILCHCMESRNSTMDSSY